MSLSLKSRVCLSPLARRARYTDITAPPQLTHSPHTGHARAHRHTRVRVLVRGADSPYMDQRERQPTGCDTDTSLPPSLCLSHVQPARKVLPAAVHRLCSLGVPAGGRAVASAQ